MKKIAFTAFAAAILASAASAPAIAIDRDAEAEKAALQPPMKTRYCIAERTTGSNITRTTCRTRAEWIAETGKDPAPRK